MPDNDTLAIARAYHDAWSSQDFTTAAELLSPDIAIEVPINSYPDKESFVTALTGFGQLTRRVRLLSAISAENEAILLYDLDAELVGPLRVAEHFTVEAGRIVRLRQIHDTAPVRAAGLG